MSCWTSHYVMSCKPQWTQYVFRFNRLFACSLSLHVLTIRFAFTTSPQLGQ
jgi:hypothetical protein